MQTPSTLVVHRPEASALIEVEQGIAERCKKFIMVALTGGADISSEENFGFSTGRPKMDVARAKRGPDFCRTEETGHTSVPWIVEMSCAVRSLVPQRRTRSNSESGRYGVVQSLKKRRIVTRSMARRHLDSRREPLTLNHYARVIQRFMVRHLRGLLNHEDLEMESLQLRKGPYFRLVGGPRQVHRFVPSQLYRCIVRTAKFCNPYTQSELLRPELMRLMRLVRKELGGKEPKWDLANPVERSLLEVEVDDEQQVESTVEFLRYSITRRADKILCVAAHDAVLGSEEAIYRLTARWFRNRPQILHDLDELKHAAPDVYHEVLADLTMRSCIVMSTDIFCAEYRHIVSGLYNTFADCEDSYRRVRTPRIVREEPVEFDEDEADEEEDDVEN